MFLKRWIKGSLKSAMIALVAFPLAVATLLGAIVALEKWNDLSGARLIQERSSFIAALSTLVHEQQLERGGTSVFLSSQGTKFRSELEAQRKKTDAATQAFIEEYRRTDTHKGNGIEVLANEIVAELEKRAAIRDAIDRQDISLGTALGHYTGINGKALAIVKKISSSAGSPALGQMVLATQSLMYAKEFAGIERAVGSGGFAAGDISLERGLHLKTLIARQESGLDRFFEVAKQENIQVLRDVQNTAGAKELVRLREVFFDGIATGDMQGTSANAFFAASTERINGFKNLEDSMVGQMAQVAAGKVSQAFWALSAVFISLVAAFIIAVTLTWYSIYNMLRAVRKISDAGDSLAKGEADAKLPEDSPKELGRIVWSINFFRESVKQAQERDAENVKQKQERDAQESALELELEQQKRASETQEKEAAMLRQQMVDKLKDGIKTVVDHAVEGDFSKRVDVDFADAELVALATNVNELVQSVEHGIAATGEALSHVADGDLTHPMQGDFKGAFEDLQNNTNGMISGLKNLIGDIAGSTSNLSSSSNELRDTSDVLSRQAEQNAASLEETSAALEELTASIRQVSQNVEDANNNARQASNTAAASSGVAADAAAAMNRISGASKEIAKVVTVINDISFQINLLALNAGVEAARAGEAGRGFSVVASEVRQLAQRAGEAAKEIDDVIARSDQAVLEGVEKVKNAQISLEEISESVVGVSSRIDQISSAISEQVHGIGEINGAVAQIDENTQKQAASFEEVTATGTLLSKEADGLKQATVRFKTGQDIEHVSPPEKTKTSQTVPVRSVPPVARSGNLAEDLNGWEDF